MTAPADLAQRVGALRWYHTIDLGRGVVTQGMFDHRPVVDRYLLPEDLSGMRCLDVGTMDGFWAFELERRGAAEVIALDLDEPDRLDWPAALRDRITDRSLDETKTERFELVKAVRESKVERVLRSVYELDTDLGQFDLVFSGDLLVHLKDPVTAVERMRRVCRGSAIIANPIAELRFGRRTPLARLDGIDEFEWWLLNQAGMERLIRAAGFARVDMGSPFNLPARGGGKWKGRRGVVRAWV
jgi:tRNA (mo5U34)-methyltransferase